MTKLTPTDKDLEVVFDKFMLYDIGASISIIKLIDFIIMARGGTWLI